MILGMEEHVGGEGDSSAPTVVACCVCGCSCETNEIVCEWDIVKEGPRVVEFRIPRPFQISHRRYHVPQFLVPYQRQECGIDAR